MSRLDTLPPDQRAVLSLVLEKGRGYAQIATLLQLDETVVRERAHAAVDAVGPHDGSPPAPQRRAEIGDYLLGQRSSEEVAQTRSYLESSASGRAWARVVAGELRSLATGDLPEIPVDATARDDVIPTAARAPEQPTSSRRGGAILLAGVVAVGLVALVVALLSGGGSHKKAAATSTTATTPSAAQTKILAQINLLAPRRASRPLGVATLVQQGSAEGLALQIVGLQPSSAQRGYAVWLYNSHTNAQRIGFAPPVKRDGKLGVIAPVPSSLSQYRAIIITRETSARSTRPGPIVLSGALPGHALKP